MTLKFEGFEVGQRIRAYDFQPMGNEGVSYVEGVIVEKSTLPVAKYLINVLTDTAFPKNPREIVSVPMQLCLTEWDGRVTLIPVDDKKEVYVPMKISPMEWGKVVVGLFLLMIRKKS